MAGGGWMEGLGCGGGDGCDGGGSSRWLRAVLQAHIRGAKRRKLCQTILCKATASSPPTLSLQSPPHTLTLLSSNPAATEAEVKNRGSLVTLDVKASHVLRGDTPWKQTTAARLCSPDVCLFPLLISPFWSDTVTDLHRLQLRFGLKLT